MTSDMYFAALALFICVVLSWLCGKAIDGWKESNRRYDELVKALKLDEDDEP